MCIKRYMSDLLSFELLNTATIVHIADMYVSVCRSLNKYFITRATVSKEEFIWGPYTLFSPILNRQFATV